eukprot:2489691-Rhodomonas_salina.2
MGRTQSKRVLYAVCASTVQKSVRACAQYERGNAHYLDDDEAEDKNWVGRYAQQGAIRLRLCYAMSGTDIAYAATSTLRACVRSSSRQVLAAYAMSGTVIPVPAYAMPGTEILYNGTTSLRNV